jgi:hypothetical protein
MVMALFWGIAWYARLVRDGLLKPPLEPARPSEFALFEHCSDTITLFLWDLSHQGLNLHVLPLPIGQCPRDVRVAVVDVVVGRMDCLLIVGHAAGAAHAASVVFGGWRL